MSGFDDYRREIVTAFGRGEPHAAYRWAKGWIGSGGGARTVEPWLVYVEAARQEGQRRPAVRAADLALAQWIEDADARAVLRYVRGEVIRRHLSDPKAALSDLAAAREGVPRWLADDVGNAYGRCEAEAASARKRKPSVADAPAYAGTTVDGPPTPVLDYDLSESPPPIWATVRPVIAG